MSEINTDINNSESKHALCVRKGTKKQTCQTHFSEVVGYRVV